MPLASHAELAARFAAADGGTRLVESRCRAPLKLAKVFGRSGGGLDAMMMDASPGLMSGDDYRISLELGAWADVRITNQSFTRVHPCGGASARQELAIRLAEGARLHYAPQPVMLYAGAALTSRAEVWLDPGSMLILSEVLAPGRSLRGEAHQYRFYDSRLSVYYGRERELIHYGSQRYEPESGAGSLLQAAGLWQRGAYLAALYVFSDRIGPQHKEAWQAWAAESRQAAHTIGVSLTYKHGLMLAAMGASAWELQRIVGEAGALAGRW